jgi:CRISPR/Cas system Type II protein with McrA/HNH and RuvC-like nuclease domain
LEENILREQTDIEKNLFHLSGIDENGLRELIEDLGQAIEDDLSQAISMIEDLKKMVEDSSLLGFLEEIEENLRGYDTDTAVENYSRMNKYMDDK